MACKLVATDRYPYVTTVADVMEMHLRTIAAHEAIDAARTAMARERIRHLVIDRPEIVGLFSARDLLYELKLRQDGCVTGVGTS